MGDEHGHEDQARAYFDERAPEYDAWWLSTGEHAGRDRPGWAEEVQRLVDVVAGLSPGRVLDVACGTGFLTRHLRGEIVGLDQSARMAEIAAARMPDAEIVVGEAVPLAFADGRFDRVFTSLFFHHLQPEQRAAFVAEARRVARELVVVEMAHDHGNADGDWIERVGADGTVHRFYKHSFTTAELVDELGGGEVLHDGRWFVVVASPTPETARHGGSRE